jgi:methylated-DNA-[protein]-cysteine S-methyltransferase
MTTTYYRTMRSPVGTLTLAGNTATLRHLNMTEQNHPPADADRWKKDAKAFGDVVNQLEAYFAGDLRKFTVDYELEGTDFQRRVWGALEKIPYGQTRSYGEVAVAINRDGAQRAVGLANGRNPVAIIVPCHRVIGASGRLVGYGGGLDRKVRLLELEHAAFINAR